MAIRDATMSAQGAVSLNQKLVNARQILVSLERVAVAFSAGVDSTLVLKLSIDTLGHQNVVAVTGRSESLARAEFDQAKRLTESLRARHVVIDTEELSDPRYTRNPTNRCYYCKSTLYERVANLITGEGLGAIVDGTNADDLGDHRPGLEAAREHGVRSPLAEARITKAEVRVLAQRFGLETFDKPAAPCLSSRIPYGQAVTPAKLRMIEDAEVCLHELGIAECRVRHYGEIARVEVDPKWFPLLAGAEASTCIADRFQEIGFSSFEVDPRGFRSGSLNELVSLRIE
jgi:uncharacterized protein